MKAKHIPFYLAAAVAVFFAGRLSMTRGAAGDEIGGQQGASPEVPAEPILWTCPMHPQIVLPDFVPCPVCGMDLVEQGDASEEAPEEIVLGERARALARIRTTEVRRSEAHRVVRMVGKLDYDETLVSTISAWVPGRLERLYVDYTGLPIQAGEHLIELYSPDLLTAQEELLAARARLDRASGQSGSEFLQESDRRGHEAARQKLLLWGLTEGQVDAIEERGTASDRVTIFSPQSGTVIEKRLDQGAYVQTGTPVYKIADLEHLWVQLEAYEQDLPWLAYGQGVDLQVDALPGELFSGRIIFIDPHVDMHTRTSKVRVHIDNAEGRLKPGMYVRADVQARLGKDGRLLSPPLAGKWVSPMHPEVVADGPGSCTVCGMDLVPAEQLGLGASGTGGDPLVVPTSAVLLTGKRAVVYVELPEREEPTYRGRVVRLGPRAGEQYVVLSGLEEGERVVSEGAFRIDSAMQIRAKPSMMSMPASAVGAGESGSEAAARSALAPVVEVYLVLSEALAADDYWAAKDAAEAAHDAFSEPEAPGLTAREAWEQETPRIRPALQALHGSDDITEMRQAFHDLSVPLLALAEAYGLPGPDITYRVAHCPMAMDGEGASWIQTAEELANPYYGAEMLRCGTFEGTHEGRQ